MANLINYWSPLINLDRFGPRSRNADERITYLPIYENRNLDFNPVT